ncbi:MAG: 50S ribosomal protein L11 methyltransferase [Clostridia bacterium]|nr:50S ribosomal protein L11 methyltransferase [Clostridia bacterium]
MLWSQLKVTCNVKNLEEVCSIMSMLENSIQVEDYSDLETGLKTVYGDLIDESILKADKSIASCSIYVPEERNINEYISFINTKLNDSNIEGKIEILGCDEEEWSTAWKKYYKPTRVGKNIVVVPSWEKYEPKESDIIIDMDPGMAFGTGTHETTRLCAQVLEKNVKQGDYMLDVGSGSGILAIIAKKLGADYVSGCDIDEVAVRTEKENAIRNNCDIEFYKSDLLKSVKIKDGRLYDIVTANIVADIIIRMSNDIGNFIRKDGLLIVSGIIVERESEVDEALINNGFTKVDSERENGWCACLFKKN